MENFIKPFQCSVMIAIQSLCNNYSDIAMMNDGEKMEVSLKTVDLGVIICQTGKEILEKGNKCNCG
jgi:methylaspartate ammonia-lyase